MKTVVESPRRRERLVQPDKLLLKALRIIQRRGWVHGGWTRKGGARCLVGAINEARGRNSVYQCTKLTDEAVRRLGFESATEAILWNDHDSRTFEEVVERLERGAYGL